MSMNGNSVVINEEEYNAIEETIYLNSVSGLGKELNILKNLPSDSEEFVSEDNVNWKCIA